MSGQDRSLAHEKILTGHGHGPVFLCPNFGGGCTNIAGLVFLRAYSGVRLFPGRGHIPVSRIRIRFRIRFGFRFRIRITIGEKRPKHTG